MPTKQSKSKGGAVAMPPKSHDEYMDEDDHRTLSRAEDIRMDAKRMQGVRRHQRKMTRTISRMSRVVGGRAR